MFHLKLKETLNQSISNVTANLASYVTKPGKDFSRVRKLSPDEVISYLISQGASSTKCEWLDFFQLSSETPSVSALNQRRSQLMPEAVEAVFREFNSSARQLENSVQNQRYQYVAADGSTISFFSFPRFASEDYFISEGHSARGFYSMHINAFFDLDTKTYTDAIIQSAHNKDEFLAFCQLVDRHEISDNSKCIFIGDRGYCSYNNMAHVIEKGQYFLFRTKDITSKGLIGNFDFPDSDTFDISVNVTLTRSHRKSIKIKDGFYRRFVDCSASFDYITYGSADTYDLTFRIVRFPISDGSYECIVTNLPKITLLLLYKSGYMVGQYISIEKAIAETKESYYDTLAIADYGWLDDENDPKKFIKYMLGIILSCYREFENRVSFAWQTGAKSTSYDIVKQYAQTKTHTNLTI